MQSQFISNNLYYPESKTFLNLRKPFDEVIFFLGRRATPQTPARGCQAALDPPYLDHP
jgi:hypothetical protein